MPAVGQDQGLEKIIPAPEILSSPESVEISSVEADRLALKNAETSPAARDDQGEQERVPTEQQVEKIEKEPVYAEVEGILEKDLKNIYMTLPEDIKPVFRQKGEKITQTFADAIKMDHVNPDQIMEMTNDWLKLMPGVSKGYLEQEAGLKTRQILGYYNVLKTKPQP